MGVKYSSLAFYLDKIDAIGAVLVRSPSTPYRSFRNSDKSWVWWPRQVDGSL